MRDIVNINASHSADIILKKKLTRTNQINIAVYGLQGALITEKPLIRDAYKLNKG